MSTIIGRRNTWIQEYLCPFKGVKGQIYWPEELHGFYCLPRSFWGCSISKVSVLPFLRSSGGNPRDFILPEFSSVLHTWSLFGCVLLILPEMGTLQSWRWSTGDSSSGAHRYHSQVTKWELRWSNEHWNEGISLDYRVDPSSLCPLSGQAQGLCMLISFSCGWYSWHEALEDTVRSWWCFGKLWVKFEAMNIRREKVKEQWQEI